MSINTNSLETTKVIISFHRKKYSDKTTEYLCSKLDQDEDADIIRNICLLNSGQLKSLKVKVSPKVDVLPLRKFKYILFMCQGGPVCHDYHQ